MPPCGRRVVFGIAAALVVAGGGAKAGAYDDARRYRTDAERTGRWEEAALRLDALLSVRPEDARARWTLAGVEVALGSPRAEPLYVEAIARLARSGPVADEARARLEFATFLRVGGRNAEARRHVERASEIAAASSDPDLAIEAAVGRAWLAYGDAKYDLADTQVEEACRLLGSRPNDRLRASILDARGASAAMTTRYEEALADFREEADLWARIGDRYDEASARANVALMTSKRFPRGDMTAEQRRSLAPLIEEAVRVAREGGNLRIGGVCHLYLAQVLLDEPSQRRHLEAAIEQLGRAGELHNRLMAMRFLAEDLARREPRDRARSAVLLADAAALAERSGDLQSIVRARVVEASLAWEGADREAAYRASLAAMDAIEDLRAHQARADLRTRLFSQWTFFYQRVFGHLVGPPPRVPSRTDLERAFAVAERRRARTLLEEMDVAGVALDRGSGLLAADGHLLDLGAIERRVQPGEAILAFSTGDLVGKANYANGGSWLLVHTAGGTRAYVVPELTILEKEIPLFDGLIDARDGGEVPGEVHLYDELLRAALDDLPAGVRHLVIVPEGPLFALPFGALRPSPSAPPLASTFELETAPSVTAWSLAERAAHVTIGGGALVLADPKIDAAPGEVPDTRRSIAGRLPSARREGRRVAGSLGRGSRVLEDAKASEAFLKRSALDGYGVLHLAAHARIDGDRPERSCILLARGDPAEDGQLTIREAAGLHARGKLVVLANCFSASGQIVEGDGAQSLVRGFLAGGARAVIGSLWPVADDEAAALFAPFYEALAHGDTIAASLAAAQRDRVAAGAPAAAWAGLMLVGDGDARLGPAAGAGGGMRIAAGLALLLLAGAAIWFLRKRIAPA